MAIVQAHETTRLEPIGIPHPNEQVHAPLTSVPLQYNRRPQPSRLIFYFLALVTILMMNHLGFTAEFTFAFYAHLMYLGVFLVLILICYLLLKCTTSPMLLAIASALLSVSFVLLDFEFFMIDHHRWGVLVAISGVLYLKMLVWSASKLVIWNAGLVYFFLLLVYLFNRPPWMVLGSEVITESLFLLLIVVHSTGFLKESSVMQPLTRKLAATQWLSPLATELEFVIETALKIRKLLEKLTKKLEFDVSKEWIQSCVLLCNLFVEQVIEADSTVTIKIEHANPEDLEFVEGFCGLEPISYSPFIYIKASDDLPITQGECTGFGTSLNFEALDLRNQASPPIVLIGQQVFTHYKFHRLGLSSTWSSEFFESVQKVHTEHPFHNSFHAVQVTHQLLMEAKRPILKDALTLVDTFILVCAGLTHDIAHPGVTSTFLVDSGSEAAVEYNDRSVLEHMSLSLVFSLLNPTEITALQWWPLCGNN